MATRIVCDVPGQGSQAVGMGKDLWEADDAVKALYQEANEALGYDLQRLCFVGPEDELRLTQNAQPAILVHSVATWMCVSRHGLQPVLLAGTASASTPLSLRQGPCALLMPSTWCSSGGGSCR